MTKKIRYAMMNTFKALMLALILMLAAASLAWAAPENPAQKSLEEAFDELIILPFNYADKAFVMGEKTAFYGDYQLYARDGRVLVPIRLMSHLAENLEPQGAGAWQIHWDAQNPEEVLLSNSARDKKIRLTVNSKTMYINDEAQALDVPPQVINGRTLLPLRSIAQALGQSIQWLDGLIIMGREEISLEGGAALVPQIRAALEDERPIAMEEETLIPLTKAGGNLYYIKDIHGEYYSTGLYKQNAAGAESKIHLPGELHFYREGLVGGKLFFLTRIEEAHYLYAYDFNKGEYDEICPIENWSYGEGWIAHIKYLGDDLYLALHYGDNTMGFEVAYQVVNGALEEVTGAKQFIDFWIEGNYFYFANYALMQDFTDNLRRFNLLNQEMEKLGDAAVAYGIQREGDDTGTSWRMSKLYTQGGYLYTLGHRGADPADKNAVYKISSDGKSSQRLPVETGEFLLLGQSLYFIAADGSLKTADLNGGNQKTLSAGKTEGLEIYNGQLYYLVNQQLHRYLPAAGKSEKLSQFAASEFFVGEKGLYYISSGYTPGLYKVESGGKNTLIKGDSILQARLTPEGLIYTLTYEKGIFSAP